MDDWFQRLKRERESLFVKCEALKKHLQGVKVDGQQMCTALNRDLKTIQLYHMKKYLEILDFRIKNEK